MDLEKTIEKLTDKLTGWAQELVLMLPNLAVAVLVLVGFWLAAKVVQRIVRRLAAKVLAKQLAGLLSAIAYLAVIIAGLAVALGVLNLQKTVTSLLAGVGIVGLALGFAFQDIAANFMSGILLAVRRPFSVGDIVETHDFFGTVQEIDLRATRLRTPQGQMVIIPNRKVFENPITNYTRSAERRVDLRCGVAYGDDLETARKTAIEAIEGVEARDASREVEFFYEEFGDSSINFVVRFWIDFQRQKEFMAARSEAIEALKSALDAAGLTIPFPIRTLDFGVVGGRSLAEELEKAPAPVGGADAAAGSSQGA